MTSTSSSSPPVWLITGCSSGFGLSLAQHVISKGHRVIASSRNPSKTPDEVSSITSRGGHWITLDVTSSDLESKIHEVEAIYGRLDVVVNNAGYATIATVEDTSVAEAEAQMNVNFMGPMRVIRAVVPGMRNRKSGVIMNISSAQGICPSPVCGIYAASKHALEALSESLAEEVASFGIRVLIVEPGAFRTKFSDDRNSNVVKPSAVYIEDGEHPVAKRLEMLKAYAGQARGDPVRGAEIMFEAVMGEGEAGEVIRKEKLLRVLIGPDVWQRVDARVKDLRRLVDVSKKFAESTDLEDGFRPSFNK